MSNTSSTLLVDIRATLLRAFSGVEATSLEAAFACWVCPTLATQFSAEPPMDLSVTNYRHIAQLGFLCSVDASLLTQHRTHLESGLQRLAGRPVIMTGGALAGFATDTVALLGLALATQLVPADTRTAIVGWMGEFVPGACAGLAPWKRCLAAGALALLGHTPSLLPMPTEPAQADLRVALFQLGAMLEDDPTHALQALCDGTLKDADLEQPVAAMRLSTIDWLVLSAPKLSLKQPTREEVVAILKRLPGALRRWTWEDKAKTKTSTIERWNVQHEYHVQNMLYYLLAPIFPDLEDEFYLNPIGPKNPRADLGIPSLQLIIEVKYVRPRKAFHDMVDEIAADASLYFQKGGDYTSRYQYMIPFLWDESRRTQEYDVLNRGLNQLPHVVDSVIIPRPGNML